MKIYRHIVSRLCSTKSWMMKSKIWHMMFMKCNMTVGVWHVLVLVMASKMKCWGFRAFLVVFITVDVIHDVLRIAWPKLLPVSSTLRQWMSLKLIFEGLVITCFMISLVWLYPIVPRWRVKRTYHTYAHVFIGLQNSYLVPQNIQLQLIFGQLAVYLLSFF